MPETELRNKRRRFYSEVLATASDKPVKAFPELCTLWKELTGATFVRLWLYNKQTRQWEIVAFAPTADPHLTPKSLQPMGNNDDASVVEYSNIIENPVIIRDLNWELSHNGKKYRVVSRTELTGLQCKSFLCVPLIPPRKGDEDTTIRAAITIHYATELPSTLQPDDSLMLMGRLSAAHIAASYQSLQLSILAELNTFAEKYLTKPSRKPEVSRRSYCEEVISLLQRELFVSWGSIFYQNESREVIQCVATTGLWNSQGYRVKPENPSSATYGPGESISGHVFASRKLFISQIGRKPQRSTKHSSYKFRETPLEQDEETLSWVIAPILSPEEPVVEDRFALGILRCVGNSAFLIRDQPRNFDPLQIQTIRFISKQLAPVLQTMSVYIERENAVSVVKHDLYASLRMTLDEVTAMGAIVENGEKLHPYSLQNISASTTMAVKLAEMLDANPNDPLPYNPKHTGLEGDIVARLKKMLSNYAFAINGMRIEFEEIKSVIPRLYIDPVLTERVLTNLISNAAKYGDYGTTIKVVAREDRNWYCLDVINQGIGVGADDAARIFRGRYRGANAIKKVGMKGLGIGLKLSDAAMRRQGGRLMLTSGERRATVFSMQFPRRLEAG